jgi:signal transduction histidine kinase
VELAAHNVRLRSEFEDQVRAVAASRRRLLDSGLRERRELAAQVDLHVEQPLRRLVGELAEVRAEGPTIAVRSHVEIAEQELELAIGEIDDLSSGLYPGALGRLGLAGALVELASHPNERVDLDLDDRPIGDQDAEATVYFICAEAIANARRHAPGAPVSVTVARRDAAVVVSVSDHGPGGADVSGGTGLRGLRDRMEAVGGSLTIESAAGAGTRLEATIPVSPEACSD